MKSIAFVRVAAVGIAVAAARATSLEAQATSGMDHSSHAGHAGMAGATTGGAPSGQDAFAAIAAIVAQLEADSTTDWSKVNIEALRRHLVAMNDVTLGARATQASIPGGARMDVTGDGRVAESIRTMLRAHSPELDAMSAYRTQVEDIPGGVRWTVTAAEPSNLKIAAKIRALGFMGLLALGNHHAAHHLALARGEDMSGHGR